MSAREVKNVKMMAISSTIDALVLFNLHSDEIAKCELVFMVL